MRGASVQDWTIRVRKGLIELWLIGHLHAACDARTYAPLTCN